jgi:hypothetical protein
MGIGIGILVYGFLSVVAIKADQIYDAPVPQRCATFQDRYDVANRAWCEDWTARHVVYKPFRPADAQPHHDA